MEKVAFLILDFSQEKQNWTKLIAFPRPGKVLRVQRGKERGLVIYIVFRKKKEKKGKEKKLDTVRRWTDFHRSLELVRRKF